MVSHARCTTDFDGYGQHLWVCPVGVAMVPDGNPKKLEPMTSLFTGSVVQNYSSQNYCRAGSSANNLALLNFEYLSIYVRTIWNAINPCPRPLRIPCNHMA